MADTSIDETSVNGVDDDVVTPWNVQSKNDTGVDYEKLISE